MGTLVTIDGVSLEVNNFSVTEETSPLAAGDAEGSVGYFTLDAEAPEDAPFGRWYGKKAVLIDSDYGITSGYVTGITDSEESGTVTISCESLLTSLNQYNISAQPYVGDLNGLFEYYLSLVGITSGWTVDYRVAGEQVVAPGWHGELWLHLKQMASAYDCEIALVSGVIVLRPVRARVVTKNNDLPATRELGGPSLARSVEVYYYDAEEVTNELIYPPGGWAPEVEVFSVNAGETAEYTIELDASVSSIQEPEMRTFVSSGYESSSVYTIVANDGLPVPAQQWEDFGGSLEVTIGEDSTSLNVKLVGATGVPTTAGEESPSFSVSLASGASGNQYSTLRIVGTGIRYTRHVETILTGVSETATATEVGITIDNPFFTSRDRALRAGSLAARSYSGPSLSLSGGLLDALTKYETGSINSFTYGDIQSLLEDELGSGFTYQDVQDFYDGLGLANFAEIQNYWATLNPEGFASQVFGNVAGSRIWDKKTGRYYRIRSATITPGGITFSQADDDLLFSDTQTAFDGMTYAQVQDMFDGMTYNNVFLEGATNG